MGIGRRCGGFPDGELGGCKMIDGFFSFWLAPFVETQCRSKNGMAVEDCVLCSVKSVLNCVTSSENPARMRQFPPAKLPCSIRVCYQQ